MSACAEAGRVDVEAPKERVRASAAGAFVGQMERQGALGMLVVLFFLGFALVGPHVAPYDPQASQTDGEGRPQSLRPPSLRHPLGTTWQGRDVLSQLCHGARPTVLVGISVALLVAVIGVQVGLAAAYFGRWVDLVVMRCVDLLYGLPFLPFLLVVISVLGRNQGRIILAVSLIAWRDVARVVRSRVLTTRELPYVMASQALGAGHGRVMYVHVLPAVLPQAVLMTAFGMVWGVLAHADVTFLGMGDPDVITWGGMINSAWAAGVMTRAFWWYLPPSVCIAALSLGAFLLARAVEKANGLRTESNYAG
jgi:peptide/nickel transport system permease protein